jgi:urease accessory protein
MLYERIIGKVSDLAFEGKKIDRIEIEWFETRNRQHRKRSAAGREVAVRFNDSIISSGLRTGDVIGVDEDGTVIAVDIPPCEAIVATIEGLDLRSLCKASYEIGNRHAPLFLGDSDRELVTPYDGPMKEMLEKIAGVRIEIRQERLDFGRQISSVSGHGHDHGHHHEH